MNKEKIREWFLNNFRTHTDWTGTYVEYNQECNDIEEVIDSFFNAMENSE